VVVADAGYLVYSKQKKTSTESSDTTLASITASKEVQDACAKEINDKDFCKFASNWAGTEGSFTTTITNTSSEGKTVTVMKTENEKRTSYVTSTDGTETSAFVTLDGVSYVKDYSDGKWTKYTLDNSASTSQVSPKEEFSVDEFTSEETDNKSTVTYKKLGKEACESLTCFKYQVIDTSAPDTTQYIWFDTVNYVMRHMYTKDTSGTFDMVISYGKVTVSAPSPVKEAPDYSGLITPEQQAALEAAGVNVDDMQ